MRKLAIVALAVLGFFIVIGIIGAIVGGTEPEPTPQAVIDPTPIFDTPEPTPIPTAVPALEPTAEPTPILPTPEVEACPSPKEQDYLDAVTRQLVTIAEALVDVGVLFSRAGYDANLLRNQDWINGVVLQFAILEVSGDILLENAPPTTATAQIQVHVIEVVRNVNSMIADISKGVDDFDVAAMQRGVRYMEAIGPAGEELAAAINGMCEA